MTPQDILQLSGPRFFALAHRVGAYDGALTARMAISEQSAPTRSTAGADKVVDSSRIAIQSDPALSGLIDW